MAAEEGGGSAIGSGRFRAGGRPNVSGCGHYEDVVRSDMAVMQLEDVSQVENPGYI